MEFAQHLSNLRFVYTVIRKLSIVPYRIAKFIWMILNRRLIRIPINLITDEFAFSLDPQGWNYYCSLIEAYKENPAINLESTKYFSFFKHDKIRSIVYLNDLLFLDNPHKRSERNEFKFYLGTWPWGGMTEAESTQGGTPFGIEYDRIEGKMTRDLWGYGRSLWYEPGERYTLEFEMNLTVDVYQSIKSGYYPLFYNSFPSVTLLISSNGQMRALIYDGHHRLAALSQLEYKKVIVEVAHVVKEIEVGSWYYVRNGYCTKKQALEIFNRFFEINGRERINYLKLDN